MGKYGFTNRVIDGISLSINNLTFAIKSQGFKASIFVNKKNENFHFIKLFLFSYQVWKFIVLHLMEKELIH